MRFNLQESIKNESGVYIIKNSIDDRCYIGSTIDFYQRFQDHKSSLLNNKHANQILQNFVNKYGLNTLSFNILCFCNNKVLRYNEKLLMDELRPSFNIKPLEINDFNLYNADDEKERVINIIDDILVNIYSED